MAGKVLTREDKLRKAYNDLYNLNQRLKNISSLYYISYNGLVYLKATVTFTEVFIKLRYPEKLELFHGCAITPNDFFQFGKKLKKAKLKIEEKGDEEGYRYYLYQEDCPELNYTIHMLNPLADNENNYLKEKIIPKFYKRIFEIQDETKYELYDYPYYPLDVEQVEDLYSSKAINITLPSGDYIELTRNLFLDLKKGDYIQLARVARQPIEFEDNQWRVLFLIEHDTDLYNSYTLFNKISSLKEKR